ncbi:hypothetical protein LOK49_LG14G01034 [Camellia lanceoleosa]|uniref:Uncharacterized protein n=1 Tax=Camellia lanceoleosa TaxID=1840588 RepID=A0ACC0FAU2_9ERIC|nr:hypothetical protein LOK49_LG14G01034 [Camellia lanceoleosa]
MGATTNPEKREAIKNGYEIEYSRFFNYPKTKLRRGGGTWLSSSSPASLRHLIHFNSHSLPQVLLLISLRGKTHECFKDARNIELPCCNLRSEVTSQTENSNDVQDRANQELDFVNLIDNYSPLMQSPLNYQSEQYAYPEETTLPNDLEPPTETTLPNDLGDTCEALPPSFTDLLADCCTEVEQVPPTELEEVDLKSKIARYMTTTSFHDMLSKLEKVVTDMGGDLAL